MFKLSIILVALSLLVSCANPLNQATSDRYMQQCADAERAGRLDVAEEACYRSVVNVEWGNLDDELKSERLYNLARIKRIIGKLDEAEQYFIETINIERTLIPKRTERIGRRLAELSAVYYEKKDYSKAIPYLEELLPISTQYEGSEKEFLANLFHYYSIELEDKKFSNQLQAQSIALGFNQNAN